MILTFVDAGLAGGDESAFLHHTSRRGIVYEMAADERWDTRSGANVVEHQLQSLGANTLVPIGLCYPVARDRLVFAGRQFAVARRAVPDGTYRLASRFEFDGPVGIVVKHGADNVEALLHALVWWPTCT